MTFTDCLILGSTDTTASKKYQAGLCKNQQDFHYSKLYIKFWLLNEFSDHAHNVMSQIHFVIQ